MKKDDWKIYDLSDVKPPNKIMRIIVKLFGKKIKCPIHDKEYVYYFRKRWYLI